MSRVPQSQSVRSADGTRIAFERRGDGQPLILVEAAGHFRGFSSFDGLVPVLSREFTVFTYDRRGRGESTDTAPYSSDREVEDLDTLIAEAGGRAHLYGYSSGALLAIRAAAQGLPVDRLALLEPPLNDEAGDQPAASDPLTKELQELVRAGRNSDAVEHFHRSIGVPAELIAGMVDTPAWTSMESVAHTLSTTASSRRPPRPVCCAPCGSPPWSWTAGAAPTTSPAGRPPWRRRSRWAATEAWPASGTGCQTR